MLNGKVAVVTGGTRGIGRAAVKELVNLGADVAVIYSSNTEAAENLKNEMTGTSSKIEAYRLDVSDFEAVKKAVAEITEAFGRIDILVNSAGITRDRLMVMMPEAGFDDVIGTNLKGTFNMIRHCAPLFIKQRSGKIINLTSVAGLIGNPGQTNYSASKAGVVGLTKSTAKELAGRGICCNAVAPGFVETDMTANLKDGNKLLEHIPMKRMAKPEEIAKLIAFLASESADYITGEIIRIDGGIGM